MRCEPCRSRPGWRPPRRCGRVERPEHVGERERMALDDECGKLSSDARQAIEFGRHDLEGHCCPLGLLYTSLALGTGRRYGSAHVKLTTLVDAPTLFARLADASLRIVDCRFMLDDPAWGEHAYEDLAHPRGGVCRPQSRPRGPAHTGPTDVTRSRPVAELRRTFGRLGIDAAPPGRRLRPGHRDVRQPALVDAALARPRRGRRARWRLR